MSRIRSNRNGENLLIEEVESQHLLISSEYNFARGVYAPFACETTYTAFTTEIRTKACSNIPGRC